MSVKLQIYVSDETASQLDEVRGLATRSTWCKHQIESALGIAGPVPVVVGAKGSKRRMPKLRSGGGGGSNAG